MGRWAGLALAAASGISIMASITLSGGARAETPLALNGSASREGTFLRLNGAKAGEAGSIWYPQRVDVAHGFDVTFTFRITPKVGRADGMAFVIQDAGATALGGAGGNLGYGRIPRSLAVELDTFQNSPEDGDGFVGDPNDNHVAVHTQGEMENTSAPAQAMATLSSLRIRLSDGRPHQMRVRYAPNPIQSQLSVWLDNAGDNPDLIVGVDLATRLGLADGKAWLGFTSGTGGQYEIHDVMGWCITATGTEWCLN